MNIFEYFEASGQVMYIDHKRERTFWKRDDGAEIVPWDGSYRGWISKDWYKPGIEGTRLFDHKYGHEVVKFGNWKISKALADSWQYPAWPLRDLYLNAVALRQDFEAKAARDKAVWGWSEKPTGR